MTVGTCLALGFWQAFGVMLVVVLFGLPLLALKTIDD